ncbi:MAG: hypothetical protein AAFR46_02215 [Pseudomonadota bacterium]
MSRDQEGNEEMIGTILIGSCVSVQGEVISKLPGGRLRISVGEKVFTGRAANPMELSRLWPNARVEQVAIAE